MTFHLLLKMMRDKQSITYPISYLNCVRFADYQVRAHLNDRLVLSPGLPYLVKKPQPRYQHLPSFIPFMSFSCYFITPSILVSVTFSSHFAFPLLAGYRHRLNWLCGIYSSSTHTFCLMIGFY